MFLNGAAERGATFGPFRLDFERRALFRADAQVPLGARALDVLCVLAGNPETLVTKAELMAQVWPGAAVEENNIQVQIWALRKALGKSEDGRDYIATIPGRGYRLDAGSRRSAAAPRVDAPLSIALPPFAGSSPIRIAPGQAADLTEAGPQGMSNEPEIIAADGACLNGETAFGPFRLDPVRKALYRDDALIPLGARALDVLCVLAAAPDRLVTKDQLMERVWPGVVVEENNIQVQVWALRKVLGRRDDGRDYIVTMPGRGYRFCWKPRVESQAPRRRADDALPPLPDKPSIAVLPFANMSEDTARDYFADGVVEDIITLLSRIRWLFVIARNSSFIYKGRAVDIRAVGRELGVRYVLEGSVRFAADRVRITAQLIEAETGSHIWAERYDRPLGDIFDLQDEITSNIVAAIEPNLHSVEIARAKAKPTQSLDAYDLYRRALPELYELTEESCRRADDLLRRALARDPDYADALAALTECITRRWLNGWVRIEEIPAMQAESLRMAQRAVAADPQNGIAIATAAYVFACHMRRFDSALEYAERALQLHPNSAHVRSLCAGAFIQCGESERAIAQYNVTLRLNPVDPRRYLMFTGIAMAHFFAYRFEEAAHWARRSLDEKPEWAGTRRYHAAALAQLGRIEEARDEIAELLLIQPNSSIARSRANSFRHDWMYDLYLGALRAAGLPES